MAKHRSSRPVMSAPYPFTGGYFPFKIFMKSAPFKFRVPGSGFRIQG
jgi:hypothetical protein